MTVEEIRKVIDELESQGSSKEEIAGAFYLLFRDDKIDAEQLETLVNELGYELTDEFKNMSTDEQKENGYELTNDAKDNIPTPPRKDEDEDNEEEKASKLFEGKDSKSTSDDDNDNEEEKAMKLFGR